MPNALDELAARIAKLEAAVPELARSSRLAHSSIDDGALTVTSAGKLRAVIGQQPDGTTAVAIVNGPAPAAPGTPTVTSILGGIAVAWTGDWAKGGTCPANFARVQVHLLPDAKAQPDIRNPHAAIESPAGGTVLLGLASYDPVTVRLVAVNTSGTPSTPSAPVQGSARRLVGGDVEPKVLTAAQIDVDSLRAGILTAGSVTADMLKADAIDGKTIKGVTVTGGILQTAGSGRRVLLTPTDPVDGSGAPSALLYSGATAEQEPARLTAEVRTTPDGAVPMTRLTGPQLTKDGNHTPRLWLNSGAPGTGYPARGGWALGVAGEYGIAGEAVIGGAAGDATNAASVEMSVRRSTGGYKTALTHLNPEAWFTQLADQVAAMYLNKDGLTVRALLGEVLLQTGSGLRVQGGDVVVTDGVVRADSAAWKAPTFQNGCTSLDGWRSVGVKRMPDGTVMLRGVAAVPAGFQGGTVAVIDDAALQPKVGEVFTLAASNPPTATLFLQPSGALEVWTATGAFGGWISFSGVRWSCVD